MAPNSKLTLPATLLQKIDPHGAGSSSGRAGRGGFRQQSSRKDQRKDQRVQKKQHQTFAQRPRPAAPAKSARKRPQPVPVPRPKPAQAAGNDDDDDDGIDNPFSEDEEGASDAFESGEGGFDNPFSEDEEGASDAFESDEEEEEPPRRPGKSSEPTQPEKRKLDEEDAEIAALEKKLGLKKGKSSKAFNEDGLGDILGDIDEGSDGDNLEATIKTKRKAEADEWLAQKRRKAEAAAQGDDDDEFEGFSGDEDRDEAPTKAAPRQRENPFVAPSTGVAKYVPPSLRKQTGSVDETEAQLRRRVQGLINRLTDESMVGILKEFSGLYDKFARRSVTTVLIDLIIALVCSPEKRPDAFFAMVAGFIAGAQKTLADHVSELLIERLVLVFKEHHDRASGDQSDAASKHIMALLAELYNMQVVASLLVFDYVRLFLGNLSELNTELLLKIIQSCGPALRREDPQSLKEIIGMVKPADLKNMSVRTSFMIEEMKKLQSSKSKAAARNKHITEQRTQIRKRIGALSGPREVRPLRIGLKDIENADTHGKWWVTGASWAGNAKNDAAKQIPEKADEDHDDTDDLLADNDDLGIPDLWQLAKTQGFNTDIKQRIFVALHSATGYENAELLINRLRLNKHQRKEIPEVIVRSGERLADYNPYYWLVASRFCIHREMAFQFRHSLTQRFRKMGEEIDMGDDLDDEDEDEEYSNQSLFNVSKFYGSLVANRSLSLEILKYRNLAALHEKTRWFVEMLLVTVLQMAEKEEQLQSIFGTALQAELGLATGIVHFLDKHVRKTKFLGADKAKIKANKQQCALAIRIVEDVIKASG
ncbi:MIF4G domain-containing protein [Apiospora hydei]|uniref:MIF4G domain-containing protein n=1 Tax=Apiospora hydei TaxID=1337664 RepID=A0ABR1WQ62_9PEZI